MNTKEAVLSALEASRNVPLSGEELAQSIGVSRTAVWKAINALREQGYEISAATGSGYVLSGSSDILSAESVKAYLKHDVPVFFYPVVESTNKTASQMAADRAVHGTTVIADKQTAGRGRRGRKFYSPEKTGIYLSIIVEPDFDLSKAVLVTAASAVAVSKAIDEVTGLETKIKWVNDIYLDGKKVSGMLTEAISDIESGQIHRLVTGIGINCSTSTFPADAGKNAGSIGRPLLRSQLAAKVIDNFLDITENIKDRKFIDDYKKRSMVLGKDISVFPVLGAEGYPAKAVDIDRNGGLVIETPGGEKKTLSTGEITIRMR